MAGYFEQLGANLPFIMLYIVRIALGTWFLLGFRAFRRALSNNPSFGPTVSKLVAILALSQFHFIFYSSRTLSNTFALTLTLFGIAAWLQKRRIPLLFYATVACGVFRFDYAVFWGAILVVDALVSKEILKTVISGLLVSIPTIGASVALDSFWYGRLVWPEWEAFHFNVIQGQSVQWGVSPPMWYLIDAIPKIFNVAIPWILLSVLSSPKISAKIMSPCILFISVFSAFPHKELRFLMPIIPLFNTLAAIAINNITNHRWRIIKYTSRVIFVLSLIASLLFTCVSFAASMWNYPGGQALTLLNQKHTGPMHLFRDVYTDMTGACSYHRRNITGWNYGPRFLDEEMKPDSTITHILTNDPKQYSSFFIKNQVQAFDRISVPETLTTLYHSIKNNIVKRDWDGIWGALSVYLKDPKGTLYEVKQGLLGMFVFSPCVYLLERKHKNL